MSDSQPPDDPVRRLIDWLALLVTIGGTLTSIVALVDSHPWIAVIAGALGLVSLAWRLRRRVHPPPPIVQTPPAGGGAYLRGLLPFEKGEQLLGRTSDASQLLTKLRSGECRFAYVSGEAGVGKTSLLRSAVLGELEKSGFTVIYCEKTGGDPIAAALRAIHKAVPDVPSATTFAATLGEVHRIRGGPLVLIWDQFEEFFIARRVKQEREEILAQIGEAYAAEVLPVRFVVSLRKEFVDDLQDFAPWVAQPLDVRFAHRLDSWDAGDAIAVLTAAAKHDEVKFAEALKEQVIRDLENGGEVRPVELQLVASRLAEKRIYDVDRYREVGAAQGILTSYIHDIVKPPGRGSDERYQRVARLALRLLCADSADAKRPVGFTYDEIVQRVAASAPDIPADAVRQLVTDSLQQAARAYVVILEDEERYNLRHDYLARSIYEATAGMETAEQQANRQLESYVALERAGQRVVIPWKELHFIRRFATPQRKAGLAAASILMRSRRHHATVLAGTCLGLLVLVTLILPPRVELPKSHVDRVDQEWIISTNGATAASFKSEGETRIWDISKPWPTALAADVPLRDLRVSDDGVWTTGITKEGAIYVWRADTHLTRDATPALRLASVPDDPDYWRKWGGVKSGWAYAFSGDGKLYLWHPSEILPPNPTPLGTFRVADPKVPSVENMPEIAFSNDGKYVAVGDGSGSLWVKRLLSFSEAAVRLPDLRAESFNHGGAFAFAPSGQRLIFEGSDQRLFAAELKAFPQFTITHTVHEESTFGNQVQLLLWPNEQRLVYRVPFFPFHQWRLAENVDASPLPAIYTGAKSDADESPNLRLSVKDVWLAGRAQNDSIYVWKAEATPGTVVNPVLNHAAVGFPVEFNPQGDRVAVAAANGETFVFAPGSAPTSGDRSPPCRGTPSGCAGRAMGNICTASAALSSSSATQERSSKACLARSRRSRRSSSARMAPS